MPSLRTYSDDDDDEQPSMPRLKVTRQKRPGGNKKPKKLLAITDGRADDDDSDGSMPELQSVSDSSGEDDDDIFVSENDEEEESDDDDETDYDSEDEELYRTMLREAMDTAMAIPEFFDPKTTVPEFDALAEERKGNPFLKLLGSLRGEMTIRHVPELHALIFLQGACFPPIRSLARPHVLSHERASSGRRARLPKLRLSTPLLPRRVPRLPTFLAVKLPIHNPRQARNAKLVCRKC